MNNECVICFEPVSKLDEYAIECGCKYTVHIECIQQWNEKCVMCHKPTNSKSTDEIDIREAIIERIRFFLLLFISCCCIYIMTKYSYLLE